MIFVLKGAVQIIVIMTIIIDNFVVICIESVAQTKSPLKSILTRSVEPENMDVRAVHIPKHDRCN